MTKILKIFFIKMEPAITINMFQKSIVNLSNNYKSLGYKINGNYLVSQSKINRNMISFTRTSDCNIKHGQQL